MAKWFIYFYTVLVIVILVGSLSFPKYIELTRNHIFLLVILFFISILPTLESGKISYLFEFKRNLAIAKKAVSQMKGKSNNEAGKRENDDYQEDDACSATSSMRKQVTQELSRILKRHKPESFQKNTDPLKMAQELRDEKVITADVYAAVKDVLILCAPGAHHTVLTKEDIKDVVETARPVIKKLKEIL